MVLEKDLTHASLVEALNEKWGHTYQAVEDTEEDSIISAKELFESYLNFTLPGLTKKK